MGLVLSIAVLITGTIVQTVEAKGPPDKEPKGPTSKAKLSCNDRKGLLSCKVSSRLGIDEVAIYFPGNDDIADPDWDTKHTTCSKSEPIWPTSIEPGTYVVIAHECPTPGGYIDTFEVKVGSDSKIERNGIVKISSIPQG